MVLYIHLKTTSYKKSQNLSQKTSQNHLVNRAGVVVVVVVAGVVVLLEVAGRVGPWLLYTGEKLVNLEKDSS